MTDLARRPGAEARRLANVIAPLVRTGMRALSAAAPPLAGRAAFEVFVRPPRTRSHPHSDDIMNRGRRFTVPLGTRTVTGWTWGTGPAVLMVHGWGGRASQLAAFVDPLLRSGMRVVAFDAPAHGSSTGRQTNVRQAADAVRVVAETAGGVHALIAHSLGATAAVLAFQHGLQVGRAALLAPPDDFGHFFHGFAGRLGLTAAARRHFERRIERVTGVPWRQFRAEAIGHTQHVPILIVHDEDDREVPISHGQAWHRAWPGAEFVNTAGLGHRALLRHPAVVEAVTRFVSRNGAVPATAARAGV